MPLGGSFFGRTKEQSAEKKINLVREARKLGFPISTT